MLRPSLHVHLSIHQRNQPTNLGWAGLRFVRGKVGRGIGLGLALCAQVYSSSNLYK